MKISHIIIAALLGIVLGLFISYINLTKDYKVLQEENISLKQSNQKLQEKLKITAEARDYLVINKEKLNGTKTEY